MASNSSPIVSVPFHRLRLQVLFLRKEIQALRAEIQEAKRLANEAVIEARALKQSGLISLLAAPPSPPPASIADTPEGYSSLKAEQVVDSLFSSIDTAFGRPRGM